VNREQIMVREWGSPRESEEKARRLQRLEKNKINRRQKILKRLNRISKEKCAIANDSCEDLLKDLEENGPK